MSSEVWIVLIVAAAVVIVLVIFRDRLGQFGLKANRGGFDVKLKVNREAPSAAPGSTVAATGSAAGEFGFSIWRPAYVEDNIQRGADEIVVGPTRSPTEHQSIGEKNR